MTEHNCNINPLETESEEDEFGGAVVDINQLRTRAKASTKETTDNKVIGNGKTKTSTVTIPQTAAQVLELPEYWDEIGIDAEFLGQTNKPTVPFCISMCSANNHAEYLHPNSHPARFKPIFIDVKRKMKLLGELVSLRVFSSPFVILDFLEDTYNIKWQPIQDISRKRVKTIKLYFFFSFKDLQYLFAKDADFLYYCLQFLERIRRITTKYNKPIALPYEVLLPCKKGMKWHALSLEIIDVSAMQGSKSLQTYLQNIGLSGESKNLWDWNKNGNPFDFFMHSPLKFLTYIRIDVAHLRDVVIKTTEFFNDIASTVGVKPRDNWGFSTGKITASIASEWIATRPYINLPTESKNQFNKKPLYWYNRLAAPEAMKQLSHLVGNQALLYLGMTDGGRCVKERPKVDFLDGVLVDIDIAGCYGNGLKNQIFPIGNPSLITLPMKFGDWEAQYSQHLIPGLWIARISWKDAPFGQDIFLSKEEKAFTAWEWYQSHFAENNSDADRQYDASMYLSIHDVNRAAFNHDLYQVLLKYAGDNELAWIRENAVIECFAYYDKRDEVDEIIPEMCEMRSIKEIGTSGLIWNTNWVRVNLDELVGVLLDRRGTHKKRIKLYNKHFGKDNKDAVLEDIPDNIVIGGIEFSKVEWLYDNSIQEFVKLIVNTIYGCIASTYFASDGTGISNFIVGNNITARARVLAWCMAKGLYCLMIITDGGVFNINQVAYYKRKSLNIFTGLRQDIFQDSSRHTIIEIKPLYDNEILQDDSMYEILNPNNHVQNVAWNHLKEIFGELDIFSKNQYSLEVKKLYTSCEIRNKSDYRLFNKLNNEITIRIRGLSKKHGKDGDEIASLIFDDIRDSNATSHEFTTKRLLGLSEWREMNSEQRKQLLPHDEISDTKIFYTITPLGCGFVNSNHRKDIMRLYEELKKWENPDLVAELRLLEDCFTQEEYKQRKKEIKARAKQKRMAKQAPNN